MFGREFPFYEVLTVWDGLFADDSNLDLVQWLCVAMLIHLRNDRKLEGKSVNLLNQFPYCWSNHSQSHQSRLFRSLASINEVFHF